MGGLVSWKMRTHARRFGACGESTSDTLSRIWRSTALEPCEGTTEMTLSSRGVET